MKLKLNIALAIVVLVFAAACNQKPKPFMFSNYSVSFTQLPIPNDSSRSCTFSVNIPMIEDGNPILVDSINAFIGNTFFANLSNTKLNLKEKVKAEFDSLYQTYLRDFSEFNSSDFPLVHRFDIKIVVAFYNEKYVTLKNDNYDYAGGAHGNYNTMYYVFNAQNGKLLTSINDLVSDTLKLKETAKQQFYKLKNIDASKPINEQGYWFEKNTFNLNNNFGLLQDTLIFTFNPYEITSYAEGQTEIKIPLK
jgi:hypothetical protein